jgi:hypothetical protein
MMVFLPQLIFLLILLFMALHLAKQGWQQMGVCILALVAAIVATTLLILLTGNTPTPYIHSGLTL